MKYNPEIHHRRSVRLEGYDYSQEGCYFVTICAQRRQCLFGEIENSKMILNEAGKMVGDWWKELKNKYTNVEIDEYVVMPNHFHGIIKIVGATLVVAQNVNNPNGKRAGTRPAPTKTITIGDIVGAFKSITTNEYIHKVKENNWKPFSGVLWQRNYYEHIIRGEKSLQHIREYIVNNPQQWQQDELFTR